VIESPRQILRYCAVGLICLTASTGALALLCEIGHINYVPAFVLCFLLSNMLGFILNGRYTFFVREQIDGAAFIRYIVVNGILLGLNLILLQLMVGPLHIWYITATILLAALNLPVSFVAHRVISYRISRPTVLPS
jgi:putative flippase GtrA